MLESMYILVAILVAFPAGMWLLVLGLLQLDRSRETVTDCATPGHANDDYKSSRFVR